MSRKPHATAHINLRVREDLRRKLAQHAERHHRSLNSEIGLRLEESFTRAVRRDLEDVAQDMRQGWSRFEARLTLGALEDELAAAIAQSDDAKVKKLAGAWLAIREQQKQIPALED